MKILYAVNSNGQGHINRSRIFIKALLGIGHEVKVFVSGKKPPQYFTDLAPHVCFRYSFHGIYRNNKVDVISTFIKNILNFYEYNCLYNELKKHILKERYDLIISDLEPLSSLAGKKTKTIVVGIDHQHAVFHPSSPKIKGFLRDKFIAYFITTLFLPSYRHIFSIDFTNKLKTYKKRTVVPIVQNKHLLEYKPKKGEYFLCYLPTVSQDKILRVFSQFKQMKFIVYGFNTRMVKKNIIFKKTDRKGFLEDVANSKAVISNAGFMLPVEICHFKKVLWALPLKNQFEQCYNAIQLRKNGIAFTSFEFSSSKFLDFLKWARKKDFTPSEIKIIKDTKMVDILLGFVENMNKMGGYQIAKNVRLSKENMYNSQKQDSGYPEIST